MTNKELALERLHRNGIISPFPSMTLCVQNLAGIQAQVQQFAELALQNRCLGTPTMKDMDKLYRSYDFINLWGQRNTLHMYHHSDWDMICDIYHNRTYSRKHISAYPDFFAEITKQVQIAAATGTSTMRSQIDELVMAHAPTPLREIDWLTYMVLNHLCAHGLLFGIPAKPSIQEFVCFPALNREQWQWNAGSFPASLDELLLRYFQYYGPASIQDFSHWSGLPIIAFQEAFDRITPELNKIPADKRTYYSFGNVKIKNSHKLTLLGKFDPLLVSYQHKEWIATPEQKSKSGGRQGMWKLSFWMAQN